VTIYGHVSTYDYVVELAVMSKQEMPIPIKIVVAILLTSVVVVAGGTYLDMYELTIDEPYDYSIHLADLIWLAIICWVSRDLAIKKKDVRLTIIGVGIVIVGFNIWEFIEYGSSNMLYAGIIEAIMYLIILVILNLPNTKQWIADENS